MPSASAEVAANDDPFGDPFEAPPGDPADEPAEQRDDEYDPGPPADDTLVDNGGDDGYDGLYGTWQFPGPPTPPPFTLPDDVVTRLLCTTAHLKGGFADQVLAEMVEPNHRAMAPNWNIDAIALARHANQAAGRRTARDLWLLLVFVLAAAAEQAILGFMIVWDLGLAWCGLFAAAVLIVAWLAAFGIIFTHYKQIHRSTMAVIGARVPPAEEPVPLPDDVEQRLRETQEANVVLFSGPSPFLGSGALIDRWALTIDIGTGTELDEGKRETPEPFDTEELHDAMLAAVPHLMSPMPRWGHRLYVVGGHALAVGGLFRAGPFEDDPVGELRFRRPVSVIPDQQLRSYLRTPHQSARPYAFFEHTAWDGQVVVTMFLRVVVTYPEMFVEVATCAQRPPNSQYADVAQIRLGPGTVNWPIFRTALPQVSRLLVSSPAKAVRGLLSDRTDRIARENLQIDLRERTDTTFAAGPSMRDEISRPTNPLHFGHVDEEMFYRTFNRAVLDCLQEWLIERRIDTVEFGRQRAAIEDRIQAVALKTYSPSD